MCRIARIMYAMTGNCLACHEPNFYQSVLWSSSSHSKDLIELPVGHLNKGTCTQDRIGTLLIFKKYITV